MMGTLDIIELIVSILALIGAVVNIVLYAILTSKYNNMVKTQTLTAQGALETQIRSAISDATKHMTDMALKLKAEPENELAQNVYFSSEEQLRNAYEDACAKYLDGKIDKDRFKKMYQFEIQRMVQDETQKEFYDTVTTPYASTIAVYKEWFGQP